MRVPVYHATSAQEVERENSEQSLDPHVCPCYLTTCMQQRCPHAAMAGNYSFGVSRIIAALRPLDRRLTPAAWLLARRCLLALAEQAAKHTVFVLVPAQPRPCCLPMPCAVLAVDAGPLCRSGRCACITISALAGRTKAP